MPAEKGSAFLLKVIAIATTPPLPDILDAGKSWLVGQSAVGEWAGKDDSVANWTGTNWDFFEPVEGVAIWHLSSNVELRYIDGSWHVPSAVQSPQNGAVIDVEARTSIEQLLMQLRQSGIIGQ